MMKSVIFIAMLLITLAYGSFTEMEYRNTFTNWMIKHNKHYANHEFSGKYNTFKNNMDYVAEWNAKGSSTVLGLNGMADLTNEEYQRIYLGTKFDGSKLLQKAANSFAKSVRSPASVDWASKGAVTPIKNQGQCGGCWSFSTTGSIEGAHQISGKNLVSLSEQQLIDCSTSYGNQGCNGGLMTLAMEYVIKNGGLDTESSYPFTGEDGKCKFNSGNVAATISSYVNITSGSESDLETEVTTGPVSVAIDASHNSFQLYSHGIYYEPACSTSQLDHGVLAIGFGSGSVPSNPWANSGSGADSYSAGSEASNSAAGSESAGSQSAGSWGSQSAGSQSAGSYGSQSAGSYGSQSAGSWANSQSAGSQSAGSSSWNEVADSSSENYWIVKNSWGTTWGVEGFIFMSKDRNNNCGIATMASRPVA